MGTYNYTQSVLPMELLNLKQIKQFYEKHPDAKTPLAAWVKQARDAQWKNPAELAAEIKNADLVNNKWLFNIGGNKYRLAAMVHFQSQRVFILKIMTHQEYDKEKW